MRMVAFAATYGLLFFCGERFSDAIGVPHSLTLLGMLGFLAAALAACRKSYWLCRCAANRLGALLPLLLGPIAVLGLALGQGRYSVPEPFGWGLGMVCGAVEELAFRGYLWEKEKPLPPFAAAALNGLLFGVFHCVNLLGGESAAVWPQVLYASAVGFALCGATAFSGSVLPAVLLHVFYNFAGGLLPAGEEPTAELAVYAAAGVGSALWGGWLIHKKERENETVH